MKYEYRVIENPPNLSCIDVFEKQINDLGRDQFEYLGNAGTCSVFGRVVNIEDRNLSEPINDNHMICGFCIYRTESNTCSVFNYTISDHDSACEKWKHI